MTYKKQKQLTTGLFIVYIFAVTWIILFKMQFIPAVTWRSVNLIPFGESVIVNGRIYWQELIDNLIIFVPYGIYICMLKPEWSFIKKAAPIFFTSLAYEILQFIFAIGSTDITDLINNTLGGIIGIGIFLVFNKIFKEKTTKIINILALAATLCTVGFIALLIIVNL